MGQAIPNHVYFKAVLSSFPGDYEIIGGPSYIIRHYMIAANTNRFFTLQAITEEEALKALIERGYIGAGVFISDPVNLLTNEDRRLRALDLSVYLAVRAGISILHDPIEINCDCEVTIRRNRLVAKPILRN